MLRSALAEAELEYNDKHVSRSVHIRFPITQLCKSLHRHVNYEQLRVFYAASALQDKQTKLGPLHAVIWTTTPWTIPANKVNFPI